MNGDPYPRASPWWRDGLVWSVVGAFAVGLLLGAALAPLLP